MTYTLTVRKGKSEDFICGLNEKEVARQTVIYEKWGYTVTKELEKTKK
jgi:hypothetical protein